MNLQIGCRRHDDDDAHPPGQVRGQSTEMTAAGSEDVATTVGSHESLFSLSFGWVVEWRRRRRSSSDYLLRNANCLRHRASRLADQDWNHLLPSQAVILQSIICIDNNRKRIKSDRWWLNSNFVLFYCRLAHPATINDRRRQLYWVPGT